jgi:hypothetical protein
MYDRHANKNNPTTPTHLGFCLFHLMRCQAYFIPIVGVHLQLGEQVSGIVVLNNPAPGDGE